MEGTPLVIERSYDAPVELVWQAISDNSQMKQWYFDIEAFKPEVGFEFQFYGGSEEKRYLHLCKVTEVIPLKKLAYSWSYKDYPGYSVVTFELFAEGKGTRLKLTHTGLDSFPKNNPDFAINSFTEGWTMILGKLLKEFVEKK